MFFHFCVNSICFRYESINTLWRASLQPMNGMLLREGDRSMIFKFGWVFQRKSTHKYTARSEWRYEWITSRNQLVQSSSLRSTFPRSGGAAEAGTQKERKKGRKEGGKGQRNKNRKGGKRKKEYKTDWRGIKRRKTVERKVRKKKVDRT